MSYSRPWLFYCEICQHTICRPAERFLPVGWKCRNRMENAYVKSFWRDLEWGLFSCDGLIIQALGNESMLKIVINCTINLFFRTTISILVISNHNSFRVLLDIIASVYIIWKMYLYFSVGNGQPRERALCKLYRHTFVPSYNKLTQLIERLLNPNVIRLRCAAGCAACIYFCGEPQWTVSNKLLPLLVLSLLFLLLLLLQ